MSSYADDHEDILLGLDFRCVTFSEAHKNMSPPVKFKTTMGDLFESLPVVWAACTMFSQLRSGLGCV